jgi:endo-1,4-beta-xylanase
MQPLNVIYLLIAGVFALPLGARAATLKEAYASDFPIGVALGGNVEKSYSPAEITLITENFNAVTPENCMKPKPVHPEEKIWHFEQADALVAFAQQHSMQVFGHTLVWHNQTPDWFFQDNGKPATRELALARMKEHIQTLVGRYKGKIRGWDVVNEALSDKGNEYLRDTPWRKAVGDDYIEQAFRFAHEADPAAELQYNDYSIEMPGKRKKAIRLIKSLKDKGVPITSVGIQGHWQLDKVPFKELEEAIREFRALGVKVAITELDLDVLPRQVAGADTSVQEAESAELQKKKPCPPEVLKRQAEQYAKLFTVFKRHKADLVRVTFWGLNDGHTWLNGWPIKRYNHPLLFDRDCKTKPAFSAVINAAK